MEPTKDQITLRDNLEYMERVVGASSASESLLPYLPKPGGQHTEDLTAFDLLPPFLQTHIRSEKQKVIPRCTESPEQLEHRTVPVTRTSDEYTLIHWCLSWIRQTSPSTHTVKGFLDILLAALTGSYWGVSETDTVDSDDGLLMFDCSQTLSNLWTRWLGDRTEDAVVELWCVTTMQGFSASSDVEGLACLQEVLCRLFRMGATVFRWRVRDGLQAGKSGAQGSSTTLGWLRLFDGSEFTLRNVSVVLSPGCFDGRELIGIANLKKLGCTSVIVNPGIQGERSFARPDPAYVSQQEADLVNLLKQNGLKVTMRYNFRLPPSGYSRKYKSFRLFEQMEDGEHLVCCSGSQSVGDERSWIPNLGDFDAWVQLGDDMCSFIERYKPEHVELDLAECMPVLFKPDLQVFASDDLGTVSDRG